VGTVGTVGTYSSAGGGTPLERRPFGRTGLTVTPLCIGCAPLGDMPETFAYSVAEDHALETLRTAFGSPIAFTDTAASYGDGESERRIGVVLRELGGRPPGHVLATKADRDPHSGDFSGDQMRRSVERSLRLLGLDRLQVCYLHDPEHTTFEEATAPGGPVETLLRLKDEGVIEHVGLAGGPIEMSIRYLQTGAFEAVITHNRYTLLNRAAGPLLDVAQERGLALVNAAPYGSGILAKGPQAYPRYAYQDAPPEMLDRVRRMDEICRRHGVPLAAAALQFSLRDPRVVSTIVGMSRPERIAQTLELARHPIPEALWPELDGVGYSTDDPEAGRWK
jgi:D-threo-aldose 1-dehydrogenase